MQTVRGSRGTTVQLDDNTASRVRFVVKYVEDRGHDLLLTEGYRPVGQPGDQYVTDESRTSTGGSNQWYQWGRYQRGLTPSAAWPGTSRHGTGSAIDWNAPTTEGMRIRAEAMWLAGMVANVPSETWHAEPLASPRVDLTPFRAEAAPTPPPPKQHLLKEAPMWLAQTVDTKRIYLVTTNGIKWLGAMSTVTLFQRLIKHHGGDPAPVSLYQSELNAIAAEINATVASDIDTREIAKTIADSIRPDIAKAIEGIDVQVGASAGEIADEIAKRLAA